MLLAFIVKANGGESLLDLFRSGLDARVGDDEVKNRSVGLATIDIVLDVEGADLVGGREALDLAVTKTVSDYSKRGATILRTRW